MSNKSIEIVVHVEDSIGEGRRTHLVDSMMSNAGVDHARFTPGRPHLMVVDYDPRELHALDVLSYVKQEQVGASLVGGI